MICDSPRLKEKKKNVYWIIKDIFRHYLFCVEFSLVTQWCPTLCDPTDCNTPGLPVHHQLPELTQTHVHRVGDAIQPSHPLSSPLLLPPSIFPNMRVFSNESVLRIRWPNNKKRYIYTQSVLCWIVLLQKDMWKSYPPAFMNVIWLGSSLYSCNWVKTRSSSWALNPVKPMSLLEEERNTKGNTLWKHREKKTMWRRRQRLQWCCHMPRNA